MRMNINELADYYAKANLSFADTIEGYAPPGNAFANGFTSSGVCGIVIPLAGSACFTLNSTPYVMEPGMVIHAGPGMSLNKEVIGNKTWRYALIHYQISSQEHISSAYCHAHFNIPVGINLRLLDMVNRLLASDAMPGSMSALRSRSLFHHLVEEIIVSAKRQYHDNDGALVEDAVSFIHENYSQQLSIGQLAVQYGMDGKRFGELFRKHIGMTPIRYLTELRIKRSKELLRTCDCSITQVAECVGYINAYYFSRLFKKITGFSPTEFRAESEKV